jgi:hypothetical protein
MSKRKYLSEQAVMDALWELRREQQMMDNTQAADMIMRGIYLCERKIKGLPAANVVEVKSDKDK